jgi:hypothetical protein
MELKQEHIANLKVLLSREDMLALLPKRGLVAEMGVDEGGFSRQILDITQARELHLIDMWGSERYGEAKHNAVRERMRDELAQGRVRIHRTSSLNGLEQFADGYFDWVYIDTTHAYELTRKELRLSRHKVKKGGVIAGHDYTTGNVNKQLAYGVVQAVNEFCNEFKWEMLYLTHESHRYLSFALREIA